jgi:CheY-like chemotaxis protein
MKLPSILLVEPNPKHARLVAEAVERATFSRLVHVPTGDEAVAWVAQHPCDVCVLNYNLPGIDGLETLVRIHQRKPDLPVVMTSDASAVQVAVSAFHAGVVDYVVKQPGFQDAVALRVHDLVGNRASVQSTPVSAVPAAIPDQLLRPTYQNRLRVIGRQLDLYGYRSINLLEVAGGFLVRAMRPDSRTPEALEFPDRDFPVLVAGAFAARGEQDRQRSRSPLLPMGYEDFLRALGYWLDTRIAEAVTVTELDQFVAVGGIGKVDGGAQTSLEPFQRLFRADEIADLLDGAYRRRVGKPSLFAQLLGR